MGGHLKKYRRAEGGAKMFGVFRVKNHDFTPKIIFFPILGGRGAGCPPLLDHFTKLPKHTYTRPEEADVTSLLNSICNFDFVITIVIEMCLAFKKGLSRSLDLD